MAMKKFVRDGAKYVCVHCKKGVFTKMEVEQCFDSHGQEAIDRLMELEKMKKDEKNKKRRA